MKTLVLSVHINGGHSQLWRDLQPRFVAETNGAYEYGVVVNGDDPALYPNVVRHIPAQVPHRQALDVVMEIFKANRRRFSHFLLLDSDCFPVRPDWQKVLIGLLGDRYRYAAPVRTENYDLFPHPCAFFMSREFLDLANFDFRQSPNLLGIWVSDVGAAMPKIAGGAQVWHPLLKTNYTVPHPLYASIYGDLFYHHCAGSRGLGFRANSYRCYDHLFDRRAHKKIYSRVTAQLQARPREFIDGLRGMRQRSTYKAARK